MTTALVWFRQDLRLSQNPAFSLACNNHEYVIPLYILNSCQLGAAQKWWLHHSLQSLSDSLKKRGLHLVFKKGDSLEIISQIIKYHSISSVYWNRCYELESIERDKKIKSVLLQNGIVVKTSNSTLLYEPWEIETKKGTPFKVYTSFWKECLNKAPKAKIFSLYSNSKTIVVPSEDLNSFNLLPKNPNWAARFPEFWTPGEKGAKEKLKNFIQNSLQKYKEARDIPAKDITSKLSPHLHFGEISVLDIWSSINQLQYEKSFNLESVNLFLSQIGWREFSYHVLYNYPDLPHSNFRKEFDKFQWQNNKCLLKRWQEGMTGYPIVDAGMRELWQTGYMHNRVRMIVASFLTKNLLIDWRLGESWFFDTLVDADLANNAMSWQWVAGSGLDAAPYFRIFNPILQSQKFDPDGSYIRNWVSELKNVKAAYIHQPWSFSSITTGVQIGKDYPEPVIDYKKSRLRALNLYKSIKTSPSFESELFSN